MIDNRMYNDVRDMLKTMTGSTVSAKTGLSQSTVSKIKVSKSIDDYKRITNPTKPKINGSARVSSELFDKIKSALLLGFKKTEIAKTMNLSSKTIYNIRDSKTFDEYRSLVKKQIYKRREREFPAVGNTNADVIVSMLSTIEKRLARIESEISKNATIQ